MSESKYIKQTKLCGCGSGHLVVDLKRFLSTDDKEKLMLELFEAVDELADGYVEYLGGKKEKHLKLVN